MILVFVTTFFKSEEYISGSTQYKTEEEEADDDNGIDEPVDREPTIVFLVLTRMLRSHVRKNYWADHKIFQFG
jgi:hypothetical protein